MRKKKKTLSKGYIWPPVEKNRYKQVKKLFFNEKLNKFGYPEIVQKFESKFKKNIKMKFALSMNSGTSALHAAFHALGVRKNTKVIAPSLTFHATATPLKALGAEIFFSGCEMDTGNILTSDMEEILKKNKISLVVITHIGGHACDMRKILLLKKKYKFKLVEDCSHAHEATFNKKKLGTFGDASVFSMDRNKLLSAGEAGVLVTNNRDLYEKALLISDFGARIFSTIKLKKNKKYLDTGLGYKHRAHPFAAAIAFDEIDNLHKYIKLRHKNLNFLTSGLKEIKGLIPPVTKKYANRGAFYSYRVYFEQKYFRRLNIEKFLKKMKSNGLEARKSGNPPLHTLPFFNYKKKKLASAEKYYNNTFSLPTFTFENKSLVTHYLNVIKKICIAGY